MAKKSLLKAKLTVLELREIWSLLTPSDRLLGFRALDRNGAEDFFLHLNPHDMAQLLVQFPEPERRTWIRFLPPDDVAHLVQSLSPLARKKLLDLIDEPTRKEVNAIMAYDEDEAGGLMNPEFIRLRPEISVDEAVSYLRRQTQHRDRTMYYAYVLDIDQKLLGVVSFRELLSAPPEKLVTEIMRTKLITITDTSDREKIGKTFQSHKLMAIPVVDKQNRMKGIVTLDDVIQLVQEQATQEIQKIGGMEALDEPYLDISFWRMIKKRAGWLIILFLSEMLTATAMGYFEGEISKAVVLALFIPLIISSGGNSGSQACTLVIRALALGEVKLRDWFRVFRREIAAGIALGTILGSIGLMRILLWPTRATLYGEHYVLIGLTVSISLVGIVLWGTVVGSILPFILRRLGFDPASASAPFVATMVDVTGLVIYFTTASLILGTTLLKAGTEAPIGDLFKAINCIPSALLH